jgi:hypothetical protein
VDIFISTFKLTRVGYLVTPFICPSVGFDTSSSVTTSLEGTRWLNFLSLANCLVFKSIDSNVFVVQQRAPICKVGVVD